MTSLDYLEMAIRAANAGGIVLLDKLGKIGYQEKSPSDLVTEADVESQKIIADILLAYDSSHRFIGEEKIGNGQLEEHQCGSGAPSDFPYTWIVDPLDGTTNFVHQVPLFAVSIALTRGIEIVCGVVYNPISKECFGAAKGYGATLNGCRIKTSKIVYPKEALITFSFSPGVTQENLEFQEFLRILPHNQAVRRTGSTALNLAWLAAGRFDVTVCERSHPWDVAAGALLVEEAGGIISAPNGNPFDLAHSSILASATAPLHQKILEILNG